MPRMLLLIDMILVWPKAAIALCALNLKNPRRFIWNGPVGVLSLNQFWWWYQSFISGMAIANSKGFSIAGCGDTLAAVDKYEYCGSECLIYQRVVAHF